MKGCELDLILMPEGKAIPKCPKENVAVIFILLNENNCMQMVLPCLSATASLRFFGKVVIKTRTITPEELKLKP